MSLFYSSNEVRLMNSRKRKRGITSVEKYACQWCQDEYESETELHVHKRIKHRPDLKEMLADANVCKICVTRQENEDQLLSHIKSAHLLSSKDAELVHRDIFICDMCNQIYFNKQLLAIHMQYVHNRANWDNLTATCPKCNKMVRIKQMWFHFQRHVIQSVACCPICLHKCENRKALYEHLKLHPQYYSCNICGYESKVQDTFNVHMQAHNSNLQSSTNIAINESLLWRCFIPRKAQRKIDYNYGLRGLRLPPGLFICVLCRGICQADEKAAHIAKYHLVDIVATKRQYMCECGEEFFNNVLLKHHVFKLKGMHKAVVFVGTAPLGGIS